MFVYGTCVGPSDRFSDVLRPSLERHGLTPLLTRTGRRSIFDAYNEILDEAVRRWPDLEGVVLLHEDVEIRDSCFEERLRSVLRDRTVGLIGVVGGRDQYEMSWWKSAERCGHVEHATHADDFSHGTTQVDCIDGLLMVLSRDAAETCRLDSHGYPGFHGYDSELSAVVRREGFSVVVTDLDVFHNCKITDWEQPELWWAVFEWALRWQGGSKRQRAVWWLQRAAHRFRAQLAH